MTVKEERKIIILGKQPMVSLPRGWVKFWKLQKAQPLKILYDSVFIVIPPSHPNKELIEKKLTRFFLKGDILTGIELKSLEKKRYIK